VHRKQIPPIFLQQMEKLIPHHEYIVRGTKMFFYYQEDSDLLVFYYYVMFFGERKIIYYKNHDLKSTDIQTVNNPMIMKREIPRAFAIDTG
jgi:hypothetical protein